MSCSPSRAFLKYQMKSNIPRIHIYLYVQRQLLSVIYSCMTFPLEMAFHRKHQTILISLVKSSKPTVRQALYSPAKAAWGKDGVVCSHPQFLPGSACQRNLRDSAFLKSDGISLGAPSCRIFSWNLCGINFHAIGVCL